MARNGEVRPKFNRIIEILDSDVIRFVQYDHTKFVLDVQFKTDKVYRYSNVTALEFAQLMTSTSVGKTFNGVIKSKKFKKLRKVISQ